MHLERAMDIQLEAGVGFVVKRVGKNECYSSLEKGAQKINLIMGQKNKCLLV